MNKMFKFCECTKILSILLLFLKQLGIFGVVSSVFNFPLFCFGAGKCRDLHFNESIGVPGKFPGDGGVVAPGMSCHYTVLFAPDSLANFQDCLLVETQDPFPLIVPIEAQRPPPILTREFRAFAS